MLILGIETTCDETSAAVVEDGLILRSNIVSTQERLHLRFGGVVPEIACRAHVEAVLPAVDRALEDARIILREIDAIAVATTPGLIGALLIGLTSAKTLAWLLKVPLLAVNHLHAHIFASKLEFGHSLQFPTISLLVSGGHTSLYLSQSETQHLLLGATLDDAVGEAFDKVAKLLGLAYPGGPEIERIAQEGDPTAVPFPRPYLEPGSLDFSFSGLKTAVLYHYQGLQKIKGRLSKKEIADIAASFQEAVVDVLVNKTLLALERHPVKGVVLGGGVACNSRLRNRLAQALENVPVRLYYPPPVLCTDNAAMVAGLGYYEYLEKNLASLEVEAVA
ncbi:MAG TPA: tRNA (adenosine(37)-N6)-threonylcarbamoyltransferase complex transferase subunit TsaD [Candidatus Hypogeohydataceae bacterium YC38]|nr:tRNA (adenosine(37)-N6)-threonylcarbamoyltransferase complex transferase subunit TsaD [Candidatus Brocadiales bacterium]